MANNYQKSNKQYRNQGPTILEIIVVGIFKGLWFLITLPFKKRSKKQGISAEERTELITRRQEIENLSQSGNEIELKHAVMEADKLVDHLLKLKGCPGETFADRLRSAQQYIDPAAYQSLWEGHKVRNQLAHENGVQISQAELKRATANLLNFIKTL